MTNEEAITILEELARCCNYEVDINSKDVEALNKAIKVLKNERQGKWDVISLLRDYVYVQCSECGQGTRLVRDSKNEFCCIKDIRDKVVACPYCGAEMKEADNEL